MGLHDKIVAGCAVVVALAASFASFPAPGARTAAAQGTFSATGSMGTPRSHHTATLLPNGKVLLAAA